MVSNTFRKISSDDTMKDGLCSGSSGFDFMEDRPMHVRSGGGGWRPIGSGGGGRGGNRPAPARLHGKQRVASLFDLLQELSVPPKPQSSSHDSARAPGPPGVLPSPVVSSSAQQQELPSTSPTAIQGTRTRGAAGGGGPADGGLAPRSGSISGSGQQQQQQQQETLPISGDPTLRLPPRPTIRRVKYGHKQQGVPPAEPARRVTFVEGPEEARRPEDGGGPSRASRGRDRPCRVSRLAVAHGTGTGTGTGTGGAGGGAGGNRSNAGVGGVHRHAHVGPVRDTSTKRKLASLGTIDPDNSLNARGGIAPPLVTRQPEAAAARTAAAAAVGPTKTTQPKGLPQERPSRRRRVVGGGGRLGGGVGVDGGSGGGESASSVVGPRSAPSGGRESSDAGRGANAYGDAAGRPSSSSPSFSSCPPSRRGLPSSSARGGTGGGGEGGGGGGWTSDPCTGRQGESSHDGLTKGQVERGACGERRVPQEAYDPLQWMTQGPDPTEVQEVDYQDVGSQWSSPTKPPDGFGDGLGGGARGSKQHRGSQQQQQQQQQQREEQREEQKYRVVGGASSGQWRETTCGYGSPRYASSRSDGGGGTQGGGGQDASVRAASAAGAPPPGRGAGEEAKPAGGGADDDDGGSFGDEGYVYYDDGDQEGERGTTGGGASDQAQQEEKKELLGVRGLCQMKGILLAMVDWSTADGGTETSIMPTSELKAEWPRQYIAYLEGKVVFATEDGSTTPDASKGGDAG